jgi:hypothetical protein
MKHIKQWSIFEDDKFKADFPKLQGPKVIGKINLDKIKKSKIEIDLDEIPKDFQEEIVKKVEGYFKNHPKIHEDSYLDDRVTSLLDLNNIGKPWDPIIDRLRKPASKKLFDNKKFFRFDKKWNAFTMIGTRYTADGLQSILHNMYGPIKGESKYNSEEDPHGDFYFCIRNNDYYVFTKHAFERYWERGMMNPKKPLTSDELKKTINHYMSQSLDIEMKTGQSPYTVWDKTTGEGVLKLDNGCFIGSVIKTNKNYIIVDHTFYSLDMLKNIHKDILDRNDFKK